MRISDWSSDVCSSDLQGIKGPGFPVEVYNVLGAGDAFMAGFLRGWLRGEPLKTCCTWANACGAFAVSRLLCSPESPTWPELQHFLAKGSVQTRSEEHTSELQSLMRISYAVFCLKKK